MKRWRRVLGLGTSAAVLFALSRPVEAQTPTPSWNLYQSNASLVLPYTQGPLNYLTSPGSAGPVSYSNQAAKIDIQILGSRTIPVTVDTGSTGIAIAKALLPAGALNGLTPIGPGTFNYDSSGVTPTGYYYQLPVSILGGTLNGVAATGSTTVKVLVVTSDNTTAYFGVGNNRNNTYSGIADQSLTIKENVAQGIITSIAPLGMNPLINVAVNGVPLPNQGYVVTNNQLMVGLTQANNGYSFIKLTPDTAAGPQLWNGIPVALSNNGGASYVPGTILNDTGIQNAYLKPNGPIGTAIDVSLPGVPLQQGAFYGFTIPEEGLDCSTRTGYSSLTPCQVSGSPSDGPFLNTGRQFFSGFNYLFDPVNGYVGYALSDSGLTTDAHVTPLLALEGVVPLSDGFATNLPVALITPTILAIGPGSTAGFSSLFSGYGNDLTVTGGGAVVFDGGVDLGGGNLNVQQGNVSFNAGLSAALVTVGQQGVLNNGANSTIAGDIRNAGVAVNNGLIAGATTNTGLFANNGIMAGWVANGATGIFVNNGLVTGDFMNAGTLLGAGTVGSLLNGGIVAPGGPGSVLTVNSTYVQAASGSYYVQVNAAGQSSQIAAAGGVNLQGGTVVVGAAAGSYAPRTTYTIVTAGTGGVSGTFGSVFTSSPFLIPSLSYDANDVYLTLQAGNFGTAARTTNQAAVASVLDAGAATASGDFATVISTLASLSPNQVSAVLNSLGGQGYAAFSTSMMQGARLFMDNFLSQAGGSSRGGSKVALAEACDITCDATEPSLWGAWGGGVGGFGTVGSGASTGAVTYNVGGFAAGLDRKLSETFVAGVAVGYTSGQQWVGGLNGTGISNTVQAALYGSYADGPVYVDGLAGYAYSGNQMWRTIAIPGLAARTAQGLTGANQVFGQVEGGYRFAFGVGGENTMAPFARLQAYTGTQNGFSETGAQSLNLTVAPQTTNSLRSVLGAQASAAFDFGWREKLGLQVKLGWSHEYANTALPVSATLAGAPGMSFTTYGASPQRDGVLVGVAAGTAIATATSVYARYEGTISGLDSSHAFTAGIRMTW